MTATRAFILTIGTVAVTIVATLAVLMATGGCDGRNRHATPIVAALVATVGCHTRKPDTATTTAVSAVSAVSIKDIPNAVPRFKREYSMVLANGVKMRITAYFLGSADYVVYSGELSQPDGRRARFDPEAPADKIIDSALLPSVESGCAGILKADAAWRKAEPSVFVDENGVTWARVPVGRR